MLDTSVFKQFDTVWHGLTRPSTGGFLSLTLSEKLWHVLVVPNWQFLSKHVTVSNRVKPCHGTHSTLSWRVIPCHPGFAKKNAILALTWLVSVGKDGVFFANGAGNLISQYVTSDWKLFWYIYIYVYSSISKCIYNIYNICTYMLREERIVFHFLHLHPLTYCEFGTKESKTKGPETAEGHWVAL